MKRENIKSIDDLAKYIDDSDSYPLDVEDICEENNWQILDGEDICSDGRHILYIGENGMCNIKRC